MLWDCHDECLSSCKLTHVYDIIKNYSYAFLQNVSGNKLKTAGAKLICEMLEHNHNIEVLDISGTYLKHYA
jgi:hypothetical protein